MLDDKVDKVCCNKKPKIQPRQFLDTSNNNEVYTRVLQLNMHKTSPCTVDIYRIIEEDKCNNVGIIAGIQEPNINHPTGVISQFPSDSLIYHREEHRKMPSRAALYYSRDLDIQPFMEYTGPDIATGVWTLPLEEGSESKRTLVVTSVYMDINESKVWPEKFLKLVDKCNNDKTEILILCDSNAHSTAWGERDTNKRGHKVDHLLMHYNLVIHNQGVWPEAHTFRTEKGKSIIDITISSDFISGFCSETEEDHRDTISLLEEVKYEQTNNSNRHTEAEATHMDAQLTRTKWAASGTVTTSSPQQPPASS